MVCREVDHGGLRAVGAAFSVAQPESGRVVRTWPEACRCIPDWHASTKAVDAWDRAQRGGAGPIGFADQRDELAVRPWAILFRED